jgi:ribose 1,5-bisphosphokinase
VLTRRVTTRPTDAGGEDFDGVMDETFEQMKLAGESALSWPAHGLQYAVPQRVDENLSAGCDVLANLSRRTHSEAKARFAHFDVISLRTSLRVLVARPLVRSREDEVEISHRLAQADFAVPAAFYAHEVDNNGALVDTVETALRLRYPVRA